MTTEAKLIQTYHDYLSAINAGHTDQMDRYVATQATFNGLDVTPKSYGEYIESFSHRCEKGLHFELVDIVVDAEKRRLASKLIVSGKPTVEFFGIEPNGRDVKFNEVGEMLVKKTSGLKLIGCLLFLQRRR